MRYVLVIAVLLSFTVPAKAVLVMSYSDCGRWLEWRKEEDQWTRVIEFWVSGFLSGLAEGSRIEFWGLEPQITADQVFYWMDNYCRDNPLSDTHAGSLELFIERTGN